MDERYGVYSRTKLHFKLIGNTTTSASKTSGSELSNISASIQVDEIEVEFPPEKSGPTPTHRVKEATSIHSGTPFVLFKCIYTKKFHTPTYLSTF